MRSYEFSSMMDPNGAKCAKPIQPKYSVYPWIAAKQFNNETNLSTGRKVVRHGPRKDSYHII